MAQLLTPGSILAMTDQAADRLLKLDSGDAALLYLHLLRRGGLDGLRWPEERRQGALKQLQEQGLVSQTIASPAPPPGVQAASGVHSSAPPSATAARRLNILDFISIVLPHLHAPRPSPHHSGRRGGAALYQVTPRHVTTRRSIRDTTPTSTMATRESSTMGAKTPAPSSWVIIRRLK